MAPAGSRFALPTESEREYVCRADAATPYFWADSHNGDRANCDGTPPYGIEETGVSLERPTGADRYNESTWGIFDMPGIVSEWRKDKYGAYPSGSVKDSDGPDIGSMHMLRGGCWRFPAKFCRSADLRIDGVDNWRNNHGFRFALVPQRSRLQELLDWFF